MAITEEVFYEGGPHPGDLVINTVVGATILGLPLFAQALVRRLWVRYRITNRRVVVTGGWGGKDRTDIIYKEISRIITVPRGLGTWGDMVLTLKDGSRLEMRSVPNFRAAYSYMLERLDAKAQERSGAAGDQRRRNPQ